MNKFIFALLLTLFSCAVGFAQDDDKVKGDRNVVIKQTYIEPFEKIVVGEDFQVEIIYNSKPSIEVEADENLHEYIVFEVIDEVLTFKTTKRITSSKKMMIKVNYTDGLKEIETFGDGEIRSLTSLELENATLKTTGSSKAYLNIRTDNFTFTSLDKSRSKLNINANSSTIVLGDNCKVEALLNTKSAKIDMYQKATANLEGRTDNLDMKLDVSADFNGKEFTTDSCNLIIEGNSRANVNVTNNLTVEISGSSEVYLYGPAGVTLDKFIDTAKLQKKQ